MANDADMVVHGIDFDLKVRVILKERAVRISCSLKLLAHVEQLVLLLSNLDL